MVKSLRQANFFWQKGSRLILHFVVVANCISAYPFFSLPWVSLTPFSQKKKKETYLSFYTDSTHEEGCKTYQIKQK